MEQAVSRRGWPGATALDRAGCRAGRGCGRCGRRCRSPRSACRRGSSSLCYRGRELEVRRLMTAGHRSCSGSSGVYPHGTAFRYDFVYYGLDPGTYDLKNLLRRKDGSSTADLPSMPVMIEPLLPPGQLEPNPLSLRLAVAGRLSPVHADRRPGVACRAGGDPACSAGGKHVDSSDGRRACADAGRPLRPLVDRPLPATLGAGEQAELERLLIGYWRRRLELEDVPPAEAHRAAARSRRGRPAVAAAGRLAASAGGTAGPSTSRPC